jgi:hypothetical protein
LTVTVITNRQPRDLIGWHDLTCKEQAEFDWLKEDEREDADFVRYKGWVYCTQDFMACRTTFKPWDGYASDSYFSGVVIRFVERGERVIVGRYFS